MVDVVLVEDDILLARQFIGVLEGGGAKVRHARHAAEALLLIDETSPQVIILDMLLPITSGFTLLHELQSYVDTSEIPVVVCTSMTDTIRIDELRPYGVKRLIDKTTMQPSDLLAAIKAVL